jgi:hypothetical protein
MAGTELKLNDGEKQAHEDAEATAAKLEGVKLAVMAAAQELGKTITEAVKTLRISTQETPAAPTTKEPVKPGSKSVDKGAVALAGYVYTRMPGLQVSTELGGPVLSQPAKVTDKDGELLTIEIDTHTGELYRIDVYRSN